FAPAPPRVEGWRATRWAPPASHCSSPVSPLLERLQVVGREGFEPSKAEGRQIYSLMGLTGSLPPRRVASRLPGASTAAWSWRRELNPRPADYKSAALPLSYASDKRKV